MVQAKRNRESGLASAKRWWVNKYNQPTRQFWESSLSALLVEMYEDLYATRDEIMEELATRRGDKTELYDKLARVNKALSEDGGEPKYSPDPLIDKWERELAEGKDIDLDEEWIG